MSSLKKIRFKPIKLKWIDAGAWDEISLSDIQQRPVKDYLYPRVHSGWLLKEDKDGVIIAHDYIQPTQKVDILVIPKRCLPKK